MGTLLRVGLAELLHGLRDDVLGELFHVAHAHTDRRLAVAVVPIAAAAVEQCLEGGECRVESLLQERGELSVGDGLVCVRRVCRSVAIGCHIDRP